MKKLLIISLCLSATFALSACGNATTDAEQNTDQTVTENTDNESTQTYKDGVYEATGETNENNGYAAKVVITVADGQISDVDYNCFTEDGKDKKAESNPNEGEYTYDMISAGAQSDWYVQAELLEDALIESQDPTLINVDSDGKTDSVAGVSIKVSEFVELSSEALAQAK